jgi:hypothetical protein
MLVDIEQFNHQQRRRPILIAGAMPLRLHSEEQQTSRPIAREAMGIDQRPRSRISQYSEGFLAG